MMGHRRAWGPWLLGALLAPLFAATTARADVELRWRAPEGAGCPDRSAVALAVEERLGRSVFSDGDSPGFVIEGAIEPVDDGFRARLALQAPDGAALGERVIEGGEAPCGALLRTVAIVVSLLVTQHEPLVRLYEPAPPPPPPAPTPARPSPPIPAEEIEPPPVDEGRLGLSVGLGASVRGLGVPGPAFGIRQTLGLRWTAWPLELVAEVQVVPPFRWEGAAALDLWLWSAGASICPRFFDGDDLRLITCAGVVGGQLHAAGVGLDVVRRVEAPRLDLITRIGAALRLAGPLWVSLAALVDVPLIQHRLTAGPPGDEQVVFEGAPISLGLAASLALSFPEE